MIRPISISRALSLCTALAVLFAAESDAFERLRYQEYPELEGRTIRRVLLLGNNVTRDLVLQREMRTQPGQPFHSEDLWRDWERLVDLAIFAEVEVEPVESGDQVLVVVSVYERPTWFAAPILDYDVDDERLTYGYQLRLRNLRGLNQSFRSRGRIGKRNSVDFTWATPWIASQRQTLALRLDVEFPRSGGDELLSSSFGAATTRFIGDFKTVRTGVTFGLRADLLHRDATHPDGGVDEIAPALALGWFRDKRNVRIDPWRGTLLSLGTELVTGTRDDAADTRYTRTRVDGRAFRRVLGSSVVALRMNGVLSAGEIPLYRRLSLGGGSTLRGQSSGIIEANNVVRAHTELRFPLLSQRRFNIPIPFAPKRLSNFDLRIDGELFVDSGFGWDDSDGFREARVFTGAGFGLRVFLPVFELARIELAFDEKGRPTLYFREGNVI